MKESPSVHPAGAVDTDSSTPIGSLLLSVLATFLLCAARGMAAVMIPISLHDRGTSSSMIGVIMALETIAALLISLSFPFLLRFVTMKTGLVLSTMLRIPSLFLLAYTSNIAIWTVAVFLNSIGCFMFMILLQTWIAGMKFKSNKGLMVALYSTSISLGFAFGPLLIDYSDRILFLLMPYLNGFVTAGAHIAAAGSGGFNVRFIFLLSALLSFSALLPILAGLYMVPSFRIKGGVGIWKSIIHTKGPMFAIAMAGVSYFGVCAFITLYGMRNHLPLHESALLLSCFMMGALLLEAPLTWVSDFIDRRYVIVIAAFLSMICAVYLPIAIYVNYQAFILLFLWGGVTGAIYSTSLALIGDKYEGDELVSANAGYAIMEASGGTAGILLIGSAMEVLGSDGLPYVIMLASILYFSFALTRYRVV
ncbi:MAG: MFS transporter [Chlorobiaceae bacterium]|nr:MFS transporter [Chlorobiaceae bacterium]